MMSPMQRLAATVNASSTDRIPVFCNLIDQGAVELGMTPKEYFSNADNVVEAQLRMREKYGHDNLWSLFYVGKSAEALGCKDILFADHGAPNVGKYILSSPQDIEAFEVPRDVRETSALREPLRATRMMKRAVGDNVPIFAYITSTMTLPALLLGMEKWLELFLTGPQSAVDELLAKCHDYVVQEAKAYREAGADILIYANAFGSTDFLPLEMIESRVLRSIQKDAEAIGLDGLVYYCGSARMNPVIPLILQKTGFRVFYPSPLEDFTITKQLLGDKASFGGVINDVGMVRWSEDELRAEVERIIMPNKAGGRFFFGTVVMPLDVPAHKIKTMIELAKDYGRTP